VTNWIPPDESSPPRANIGKQKKLLKGLQHAKEILGEYDLRTANVPGDPCPPNQPSEPFDLNEPWKSPPENLQQRAEPTFEFDGLIWARTTSNEQHYPEDPTASTTAPTTRWTAMPKDAYKHASVTDQTKPKSTTEWHRKSPAPGQPSSALMTEKPTSQWQTTTPASGHPSASMDCKDTTGRRTTTPTLAQHLP
jgi:hypothetical protein